ncbi:hypothetical protein [Bacillus cereus]|uniref:hypothetical protein n=1 Tax=Bacillus cereus TaxID=1396 RepID=UPI003D2F101F
MTEYYLTSSFLKFALANVHTEDNLYHDFCETQIKKQLSIGKKISYPTLNDYQGASGPKSLGRHLLTNISIKALEISRTEEYGNMYGDMRWRQVELEPVIDSLEKEFSREYQDAIDELRYIAKDTQELIRKSGEDKVKLYRKLCTKEGGVVDGQLNNNAILMDVNILSSYTPTNDLTCYTGKHWSDIWIERYIPVDQVIIHPSYIHIADFEFAEREALIYNPSQRVIIKHPDNAFEV